MNRKQLIAVVAALVLAGSCVYILRSSTATAVSGQWFYDMATGERFAVPRGAVSPIEAPGGGEAVEAMVFACGSCDDAEAGYYLLKHEPALKRQIEAGEDVDPQALLVGRLVRAADGERWHPEGSAEARAIKAALRDACGEKRVVACYP